MEAEEVLRDLDFIRDIMLNCKETGVYDIDSMWRAIGRSIFIQCELEALLHNSSKVV